MANREEHGPVEVYYLNRGHGTGDYVLACNCGFRAVGWDGWEEAGAEMDEHIKRETEGPAR